MNRRFVLSAAAVPVIVGGVVVGASTVQADVDHARATAVLDDAAGNPVGRVTFTDRRDHTEVELRLRVSSRAAAVDAFHGFHIHANDDAANGTGCVADPTQPSSTWFVSADGHWKEGTQTHGHHLGDLPSVYLNRDGTASTRFTVDKLRASDLAGRAVVLHAGPDNFGNVPVGTATDQYTPNSPAATTKTAATGNAGDRYACGVIRTRRR